MQSPGPHSLIALPANDEALIPAAQLPSFLGIARQTLARWRCEGVGPRFVRVGRVVAYRSADVRSWLSERTYTSTSATPRGAR
jgi:predicted DNA-binding transcriptional regulator AlpA